MKFSFKSLSLLPILLARRVKLAGRFENPLIAMSELLSPPALLNDFVVLFNRGDLCASSESA